jgi:hypothetical protein
MKRQQVTSVRLGLLAAIFALALPGIALCQVAGTEGIKQGEKFAKAGGEVLSAIAEARRDIDATLTAYNTLVQKPTKDVKGDYKRLQKALEKANEASAKVKPRIDAMNVESEAYYKIWANQVANIQDADLRGRGEQRIAASRDEYKSILSGMRAAGEALTPFVKDLTDQINFLGSDLRPEALTSLKDNATKLNAGGATVFSRIDDVVRAANAFFAPLRSK